MPGAEAEKILWSPLPSSQRGVRPRRSGPRDIVCPRPVEAS